MSAEKTEKKGSGGRPERKDRAAEVANTFEWLITAFILAFVFRAFVMEAFRIPTGSMADTLKGGDYYNIPELVEPARSAGISTPMVSCRASSVCLKIRSPRWTLHCLLPAARAAAGTLRDCGAADADRRMTPAH